jgi:hypothetical protein
MSRTTGSGGGPTPLRDIRYAVLLALLSGCASNSVTTLLKASGQTDAVLPSAAVAAVIATTAQGLQQGKTLEAIKVYPEDIEAGNIISPDLFLKHAPFGLTRIDSKEIDRVIKEAKARCDP